MNRYEPGPASKHCVACAESIAASAEFCPRCGHTQATTPVKPATGWRWLYGLDGRVNRGGFLLREVISLGLLVVGYAVLFAGSSGLAVLVFLVLFIPAFAGHVCACVRRAHDLGWSGWTYLIFLVPFIGWGYWGWLLLRPSTGLSNGHGQCPDGVEVGL